MIKKRRFSSAYIGKLNLNKFNIVIYFVERALFWGIGLGFVVGFIFQLVFLGPVAYGLFGLIIGGFTGCILGLVNGVILGFFTIRFSDEGNIQDMQSYREKASYTSAISTFVFSSVIFFVIINFVFGIPVFSLLISLLAGIFASLCAFYASHRITVL